MSAQVTNLEHCYFGAWDPGFHSPAAPGDASSKSQGAATLLPLVPQRFFSCRLFLARQLFWQEVVMVDEGLSDPAASCAQGWLCVRCQCLFRLPAADFHVLRRPARRPSAQREDSAWPLSALGTLC